MLDLRVRADLLQFDVHGPARRAESGGVTVWSSRVHTDSQGTGRYGGRVQLVQQRAARGELLAGDGTGAGYKGRTDPGDAGAVQRGAERHHPAGRGCARVPGDPHPDGDPAGRVPDQVDRRGAGGQGVRDGGVDRVGLLGEVAVAVAGERDDDRGGPAARSRSARAVSEARLPP